MTGARLRHICGIRTEKNTVLINGGETSNCVHRLVDERFKQRTGKNSVLIKRRAVRTACPQVDGQVAKKLEAGLGGLGFEPRFGQ